MQLAYILPDTYSRHVIAQLQGDLDKLRDDQREHVVHLIRSWRDTSMRGVRRAIRRTISDKP